MRFGSPARSIESNPPEELPQESKSMLKLECIGGKLDGRTVEVESLDRAPQVVFTVKRVPCSCGKGCIVYAPVIYELSVPKDKTFCYTLVRD